MDKGLLREKEKVAQLVDKSTRCVDKRFCYRAPLRPRLSARPCKDCALPVFLERLHILCNLWGANGCLLIAPDGASSARNKGAFFALCLFCSFFGLSI